MFREFLGLFKKDKPAPPVGRPVGSQAPKIFISYRREDSAAIAGRISDRLASRFGEGSVFVDIDAIPLGSDFAQHLNSEIRQCDVLFAVIGPLWLGQDSTGKRRIDNEHDFVRLELEIALAARKPIVPVLVGNARFPRAEQLPEPLRELAYRNAVEVRHETFHQDFGLS